MRSQGPQRGTDISPLGIRKRALGIKGIKEGFLKVVAFEMSLEGQTGFEQELGARASLGNP